ncbi:MAG: hypothetical protein MRY74_04510 [Neomegalonema sp.]|nr:hypothetical protein [Neomegalonema sp.]
MTGENAAPTSNRPLSDRILFDHDASVLEIDLSDLTLADETAVAQLYNHLELKLRDTGRKWFFLINYLRCRIYPEAWVSFANRGKRLNETYGLGTVRYNTEDEVGREITRRAGAEAFEANLANNRATAKERLDRLRSAHAAETARRVRAAEPSPLLGRMEGRISFDADTAIMDVDFSDLVFSSGADVTAVFDYTEAAIARSGRNKWWFLINYRNCSIEFGAWVAYASRGKRLNVAHALGSVRYAATEEAAAEISDRSRREGFDANLLESRDAALARIDQMRAETNRRLA